MAMTVVIGRLLRQNSRSYHRYIFGRAMLAPTAVGLGDRKGRPYAAGLYIGTGPVPCFLILNSTLNSPDFTLSQRSQGS